MNDENLKPPKKGEPSRNPNGRGKGTLNKKTTLRKWLQVEEKKKNPISNKIENLSQYDMIALGLISKARKGDVQASRLLIENGTDEDIEDKTDIEIIQDTIALRDTIISKHYDFLNKGFDWSIIEGGSRSGKTYNFLKWAFLQTKLGQFNLNIIAPSFKMLELGSFIDCKSIISQYAPEIKIPERATKIELYNGSRWTFEIVTNENEAKRNRDNVFVNEGDGLTREVAMLLGRAKGRKFVDFNPTKKFWAHDMINEQGTNILSSNWHDNPFLSENQLEWFANLKSKGEFAEEGSPERYAYEVYYLGNYSMLSGKAYEIEDFDIVEEFPTKFDYMISYSDPSLGTGNDFFASLLFGIKNKQVWAVDCVFSQFTKTGGFIEKLKEWDSFYHTPIDHYSESNGVSGVVTDAVNNMYDGVLNLVNNTSKKEADIIVYAPTAKRFKFVRSPKMIDFLTQCTEFPNCSHDDAPDCLGRGAKLILKYFDI